MFSGLPASSSCSTLSQHTALTCPTLQHTEDAGSLLHTSHKETSAVYLLCCVLETVLLLVASLWKAQFSLPFCKTQYTTLMVKAAAQPRFATPESSFTLPTAWVCHAVVRKPLPLLGRRSSSRVTSTARLLTLVRCRQTTSCS